MKQQNLNNKLIRTERSVNLYKIKTNSLFKEINIDDIEFHDLKEIVKPKEDDPFLYDGYILDATQIDKINIYIKNNILPMSDLYFYVLESTGIYDWDKEIQNN